MDDWKERLKALVEAPPVAVQNHVPKETDDDSAISVDSEPNPEAGKVVSGT